jgi:hypothetical protein
VPLSFNYARKRDNYIGLVFLGPHCGVLEKVSGMWLTDGVYTAGEDEERRVYTVGFSRHFISSQSFFL